MKGSQKADGGSGLRSLTMIIAIIITILIIQK